jgi:hypothetical protein
MVVTLPLRPGDQISGFDVRTTRMKCGRVIEVLPPEQEREQCRAVIEDKSGKRHTVAWPYLGPWTKSPRT